MWRYREWQCSLLLPVVLRKPGTEPTFTATWSLPIVPVVEHRARAYYDNTEDRTTGKLPLVSRRTKPEERCLTEWTLYKMAN